MRRTYDADRLIESQLAPDWWSQFSAWFALATGDSRVIEANAMQLATVAPAGLPEVRTVLAKAFDERGVVFYTNHDSAKAVALRAHPAAAAVFSWLPLERQVRFAGPVEAISRAETEAYFASRPRGSQLGAWASPQSARVASRADLDGRLSEVTERFADAEIPAPPNWGGFRLRPDSVEFWQGRPDRMHDRLRFLRAGSGWTVERLAP